MIPFVAAEGERLSSLLRRRRIELGITIGRASAETGVLRSSFVKYEAGRSMPRVERLEKLGRYYRIPDEDLFTAYNEQLIRLPNAQAPGIHGSWAEAQAHYARGEKPCDACRKAANDYLRRTKEIRRRQAGTLPIRNSTGFRGVMRKGSLFAYRIRSEGRNVFASGFRTASEAYAARQRALDDASI